MANGEGDDPRGSAQGAVERERRLREELEEQDQQLKRALESVAAAVKSEQAITARLRYVEESADRQAEEAAKAAADEARDAADERVAEVQREATRAREEATKAKEEVAKAKEEAAKAKAKTTKAEEEATKATAELKKDNAANTLLKAAHAAQRGLYDFVRDSLSDILSGVDAAAADARCRQLEECLDESGFVSPGSVGAPVGGSRESVVEFDVAVIAGNQQTLGKASGVEGNLQVKAKMSVLPLGLEAGVSGRRETRSEDRSELSHHNRIRFSVPVVFASHGDPVE